MNLRLKQAQWILGFLPDEFLPQNVGVEALASGLDSNTLRILAGLTAADSFEARQLFVQILAELNIPEIGKSTAAAIYAKDISREILTNQMDPCDGAEKIWEASIRVGDPNFHDLDVFVYAASEIRSRPEDKDFFCQEILKEAALWAVAAP